MIFYLLTTTHWLANPKKNSISSPFRIWKSVAVSALADVWVHPFVSKTIIVELSGAMSLRVDVFSLISAIHGLCVLVRLGRVIYWSMICLAFSAGEVIIPRDIFGRYSVPRYNKKDILIAYFATFFSFRGDLGSIGTIFWNFFQPNFI